MIVLDEITKFVLAPDGAGLELPGDKRRTVRLELNTSEPCQLKLMSGANDIRFLANVEGRETVTFIADGPVAVFPDCAGEVWWWTPEMETTSVLMPDAEVFTKIAERKPRNVELERMMAIANANAERRMSQLMREVNGVVGELRAENKALKAAKVKADGEDPAAVVSGASGAEPKPDAGVGRQKPAPKGDDGGGGDAGS